MGVKARSNPMKLSQKQLADAATALGLRFNDISLFELALTHESFLAEFPGALPESNGRLEFLGDAVLGLIAADALTERFPDRPEGFLTQVRASLVDKATLARVGKRLGLGDLLALGKGEIERGGRDRPSNLADTFEATLGALFLDGGYDAAKEFALRSLAPEIENAANAPEAPRHPKSLLHEAAMLLSYGPPEYVTVGSEGPGHALTFTVEAVVGGKSLGVGRGGSKKSAGAAAALEALRVLES